MINLTEEEQKEEIKRIEERSLFYLKGFAIIWSSTISYFIFKQKSNAIKSFLANFSNWSHIPGIFATVSFFILIILLIYTIMVLSKVNVKGSVSYKKTRIEFLEEKYKGLKKGVMYGIITSFFFIFYFIYLLILDAYSVGKPISNFAGIMLLLIIIITMIIVPVCSLINYLSKKRLNLDFKLGTKLTTILIGIISLLILLKSSYVNFILNNTTTSLIFLLLFQITLAISSFSFFKEIFKKLDKDVLPEVFGKDF